MRASVLKMLREDSGGYLSGEELSRRLAVSRTAIWKHIRSLKHEGYEIEAHPRLGYRLCSAPDFLLPEEIRSKLTTRILGREIRYLAATGSTNIEARRLAADGCPEGQIVVAEEQTGGRGRLSRGWFSPRGKGIWLSVVLRPAFSPQEAPKCTLMAAVALQTAIRRSTGLVCGIKWPNDILYGGKKVVGILTEMTAEIDAINFVIIGMGINVNIDAGEFPPEIRDTATSLALIAGHPFSRRELITAVLEELETVYQAALAGGFSPILDQWRERSATLGQQVDVVGPDRQFSGLAIDIDNDGALLVQTAAGVEKVIAGDVSIKSCGT